MPSLAKPSRAQPAGAAVARIAGRCSLSLIAVSCRVSAGNRVPDAALVCVVADCCTVPSLAQPSRAQPAGVAVTRVFGALTSGLAVYTPGRCSHPATPGVCVATLYCTVDTAGRCSLLLAPGVCIATGLCVPGDDPTSDATPLAPTPKPKLPLCAECTGEPTDGPAGAARAAAHCTRLPDDMAS